MVQEEVSELAAQINSLANYAYCYSKQVPPVVQEEGSAKPPFKLEYAGPCDKSLVILELSGSNQTVLVVVEEEPMVVQVFFPLMLLPLLHHRKSLHLLIWKQVRSWTLGHSSYNFFPHRH